MRYFTYTASARLVRDLNIAGAVRRIVHDGGDIIHLELITGQSLMIYLIESPIEQYEIRNIVSANTAANHHTLFILWGALLLPDDRRVTRIEDWQEMLLRLYGDRIYAYEVHRGQLYLHAVHFQRIAGTERARAHFGPQLDAGAISARTVGVDLPGLQGQWRIAAFDGDPDYFHRQQAREMAVPVAGELAEHYRLLEIGPDADLAAVKAAYRRLALQHHPDTNVDDPDATGRMQALNQAYNAILKARMDGGEAN